MAMPVVQLTPEGLGTCRVPRSQYDRILLGHGSGGRLTADLIQRLFVPGFGNDTLAALEDAATLRLPWDRFPTCLPERQVGNLSHEERQVTNLSHENVPRLAFTTDAFV